MLNNLVLRDLKSFIVRSFLTVNPDMEFIDNWHIDLLTECLEEVAKGNIKRLIINIPPRYLKSVCISVAWPAWLLGLDPTKRIIVASYSQGLSEKHSQDCRLIMNSNWYRQSFPETKIASGKNEKNKFVTTKCGFRFATSIGGTLTGEGADILIVDDPHTPEQAISRAERTKALRWFDQTFYTRLNNKRKGAIVVVMQRLHTNDLTGHLVKKEGWYQVSLPVIARKEEEIRVGDFYYHRKENELLNPHREGEEEIDKLKRGVGSYAFAAQYQQSPIAMEGGIIKYNWVRRYKEAPLDNDEVKIYQSWDFAVKVGEQNDYSVCTTWVVLGQEYFLLDVLRCKQEYSQLKQLVLQMYHKFPGIVAVLVEDKAHGQSLIQELRAEGQVPIVDIMPNNDKETRLILVAHLFEASKVLFPEVASWLVDLEEEFFAFPHSAHDDQVDSITQFLNYINQLRSQSQWRISWL
jgi:predicted phage terminase large subunit-like protein